MEVSNNILSAISMVVVTIALLAMTSVVVDAVQDLNTTGWTFTGAAGAKSLIGLVPFVWVASILIAAVIGMVLIASILIAAIVGMIALSRSKGA